jgi:transposase
MDSLTLRVQAEQIAAHDELRIGAPSKLADPDTVQLLLAAIADGNYRETACKLAGINKTTFYRWLDAAENGDERAISFRNALEKAEAQAESEMVQAVRRAGTHPQYWAAAATHLERKFPDRWGKRDEAAVTAKVQVSIGGVNQAQVLVGVQVTSPSLVPRNDLAQLSTGQVMHEGLIIGDYVNPRVPVPAAVEQTEPPGSQIPAHGLPGAPAPPHASPQRTESGGVKGASRVGRRRVARKEKKAV